MYTDQQQIDQAILQFYADTREQMRLTGGSLAGVVELQRIKELVSQYLPKPSGLTVFDVGGGCGIHAQWLAAQGHNVTMVDVVPEHVEQARTLAATMDQPFAADVADGRSLPFDDDSADATLVFGPLYHLATAADRVQTLREAHRVTKPGGVVFAAGVSRSAVLEFMRAVGAMTNDSDEYVSGSGREIDQGSGGIPNHYLVTNGSQPGSLQYGHGVIEFLSTGSLPLLAEGFPLVQCHTLDQLRHEMAEAGLEPTAGLGIEGPSSLALERLSVDSDIDVDAAIDAALTLARLFDDQRITDSIREQSSHLLVIGRVPAV